MEIKEGKGYIKDYYDNKNLKFEGEYINGKIWNGKGYNKKGYIEFEIKDGKGYIKEYYDDDNIKYEGEYLNGERNGNGKDYSYYKYVLMKYLDSKDNI